MRDDLPPITTFLNRLLALTIELQGILFAAFEELLSQRIEGAIASGTYDMGLETLRAESFTVADRRTIHTHPGTGAETRLITITQKTRNAPTSLETALDWLEDPKARLLVNSRLGRAAVQVPATSIMLDDGQIEPRLRLIRTMEAHTFPTRMMEETHWVEATRVAKPSKLRSASSGPTIWRTALCRLTVWAGSSGVWLDRMSVSQSVSQAAPRSSTSVWNGLNPVASPMRIAL